MAYTHYRTVAAVIVFITLLVHGTETATLNPYVIEGDQNDGDVCPPLEQRANTIHKIRDRVKALLYTNNATFKAKCGDGLWYRVAKVNMTDPLEQCPSAWREYNTSEIRACGRPVSFNKSCPATTYPTRHPYSKVCGRVIGYQFASPDAFNTEVSSPSINKFYVDGISITHGSPRKHIWTYAGGYSYQRNWLNTCPCTDSRAVSPPSFVDNKYFCETANTNITHVWQNLFTNDKLWDGERCENEGSCCTTNYKSPPWFIVELSNPTTDNIEVRICGSESTENEDTPIELLEIYIQ